MIKLLKEQKISLQLDILLNIPSIPNSIQHSRCEYKAANYNATKNYYYIVQVQTSHNHVVSPVEINKIARGNKYMLLPDIFHKLMFLQSSLSYSILVSWASLFLPH